MEYGSNHLKPSDMWKNIKPRIGEMLVAINDIETRYGKAVDEAYQSGYEDGKGDSSDEDAYQRGINDAWEAARRVVALSTVDRRKVFGSEYMYSILEKHTASEAIEKIRQYEQEKKEKEKQDGLRQNIQTIVDQCGYTLDEIAEVLAKMRESDNG